MDLDELRVFVSVVDRGSLAAASKSLRFPIATLRRRLDELEARMGVKLLERNRQGAVPTGAGVVLVARARTLLSDVQALAELVRGAGAYETGEVRVALPQGLPPAVNAVFLGVLMDLYPKVCWNIRSVEDPASTLSEDVHAAFLFSYRAPTGPWNARKIFTAKQRLLASPAYLKRNGTPRTPKELQSHRLLVWSPAVPASSLQLTDGTQLEISPALRTPDIFLARQTALRGHGIACVPDKPLPHEYLLGDESLVSVLDDSVGVDIGFWMLANEQTLGMAPLRILLEQLTTFGDLFGT